MLTIMIHAKIKEDMLNEYVNLIKMLSEKTTKKGCIRYSFNQRKDDPTQFVLYEQWENQQVLDEHMKELFELLGPAKRGEPIPHELMRMYEHVEPVFYDVIG